MVIIIDNNLLLDLIFGFVQEKRRNNLVNIRKNLVYVWIILFETVFGVVFLDTVIFQGDTCIVSVWACFIYLPVWCDVPCLSKGP